MAEKNVTQALAAVMAEVRAVGKNQKHDAPNAKFMFRGVDAVVDAVGPALRTHGVIVVPQLLDVARRDVSTSQGKGSRETCVTVKYVFTGPDGSTLEAIVPGEAMDSGDKGTAKAMSVAFRIALLQALCLPTHDTDPDADHYERAAPQQRQAAPPQQRTNGQQRPAQQPTAASNLLADEARKVLREKATAAGVDLGDLASRFEQQYGESLKECGDHARITAFMKLQNLSSASRVAANNGARS